MSPIKSPTGIKIQLRNIAETNPNKSLPIMEPITLAESTASGWSEPFWSPLSLAKVQIRGNPMNGETKPAISQRLILDRLINKLMANHNVNETSIACNSIPCIAFIIPWAKGRKMIGAHAAMKATIRCRGSLRISCCWMKFIYRTSKSTQPDQRERASITGLRLELRKIM